MGSSFIEYRSRGFWSYDRFIELLAGEVSDVILTSKHEELWKTELATHWKRQSSGEFTGWVHLQLDEFLGSGTREREIVDAIEAVIARHDSLDDPIRQTGMLLCKLLNGQLRTTASDPLDYMVTINS